MIWSENTTVYQRRDGIESYSASFGGCGYITIRRTQTKFGNKWWVYLDWPTLVGDDAASVAIVESTTVEEAQKKAVDHIQSALHACLTAITLG